MWCVLSWWVWVDSSQVGRPNECKRRMSRSGIHDATDAISGLDEALHNGSSGNGGSGNGGRSAPPRLGVRPRFLLFFPRSLNLPFKRLICFPALSQKAQRAVGARDDGDDEGDRIDKELRESVAIAAAAVLSPRSRAGVASSILHATGGGGAKAATDNVPEAVVAAELASAAFAPPEPPSHSRAASFNNANQLGHDEESAALAAAAAAALNMSGVGASGGGVAGGGGAGSSNSNDVVAGVGGGAAAHDDDAVYAHMFDPHHISSEQGFRDHFVEVRINACMRVARAARRDVRPGVPYLSFGVVG